MRTLILLLLCIAKTLSQEQNSTTNPAVDQKLKKIIENIDVSNLKLNCTTQGLSEEECKTTVQYMLAMAKLENVKLEKMPTNNIDDDIAYTAPMAEYLLLSKLEHKTRVKRKVLKGFMDANPTGKWELPIWFTFTSDHSETEKDIIREGVRLWEDSTCIQFREFDRFDFYNPNSYIKFTGAGGGCWSYVGKIFSRGKGQSLNLQRKCLMSSQGPGIAAHEIGHTLGMWHEHARPDRDEYVIINKQNMRHGASTNFRKVRNAEIHGVTYDMGSVMHYHKAAFTRTGKDTLSARGTDGWTFKNTMGQRWRLSFNDVKAINYVYCNDVCPSKLPCQNGGYTDPKDCYKCRCPEGLGGTYCEEHQRGTPECSKTMYLDNPSKTYTIESPNTLPSQYEKGTKCSWLLKAPKGYLIHFKFVPKDNRFNVDFAIPCGGKCYDHVELKIRKDLTSTGGRFCCYKLKREWQQPIVSEINRAVVMLRTESKGYRGGFKVQFNIEPTSSSWDHVDVNIDVNRYGSDNKPNNGNAEYEYTDQNTRFTNQRVETYGINNLGSNTRTEYERRTVKPKYKPPRTTPSVVAAASGSCDDCSNLVPGTVRAACQKTWLVWSYNKCCSGSIKVDSQCIVPDYWNAWSDWSECSKPCGCGTRYRVKQCVSDHLNRLNMQTGKRIQCMESEIEKCNSRQCAIWECTSLRRLGKSCTCS